MVLEKTLESPLDCKEIQPVHSKEDQAWVFFVRNDAKAETPVLWPPHAKSWLIWKDPDAGRDWEQEEKGMPEYEMAGWHHWLDGRESEWTPGVGDGQGGLVCCYSWDRRESDTTERLNWTEDATRFPTVTSVFITFTVFCFKKPLLQMGLLTALQLRFNPFAEGTKSTSRFWADWLRQVTKLSGFFLCWLKFLFFRTYCSLEALCLAAKNKWTKYPPNFVCG